MTDYAVVLEEADDGGWWAYAPDLPGVISGADTPEDRESGSVRHWSSIATSFSEQASSFLRPVPGEPSSASDRARLAIDGR